MNFYLPKRKNIIAIAIFALSVITLLTNSVPVSLHTFGFGLHAAFAQTTLSQKQLTSLSTYSGLPVSSVKVFSSTTPSKKIAIYIPQYHISPADMNASSAANDNAVTAQQQIYQIEKFLLEKSGSNFIMDEGEYYNHVDSAKITSLTQKISLFNTLNAEDQKLKNSSLTATGGMTQLLSLLNQTLTSLSREIILTDAAHVLKAEGNNFDIVGVENTATMDKARLLVRNYVYLQDRISEVQAGQQEHAVTLPYQSSQFNTSETVPMLGTQTKTANPTLLMQNSQMTQQLIQSNPRIAQLLQMLGVTQQTSSQPSFTMLEDEAQNQGNGQLAELIAQTQQTYDSLQSNEQQANIQAMQAAQNAPSRGDNPYASITNIDQLQQMSKDAENKLIPVVVDERNAETALHFAQTLNDRKQTIGMIQFGAGHEEGMIKDLNKQGITVVEVMPTKVAQLNSTNAVSGQESSPV